MTCQGARAAEARLLAELAGLRPQRLEDAATPVRILVPSRSLRLHLCRRIATELGSVAGVVVQTVHGAALEILDRAGEAAPAGDLVFELLVRRWAATEADLAESLEAFDDGTEVVLGVVRDLMDAGFEPHAGEAVFERLAELESQVAAPRLDRARALIRLAAKASAGLAALGVVPTGLTAQAAAAAVGRVGGGALPTRALLVHGFADVTGVVADLLTTLLRTIGGVVILDRPPDPAGLAAEDPGVSFLERWETELGWLEREVDAADPPPPELVLCSAPGREAEGRAVSRELRRLLDDGATPESMAVVGRDAAALGSSLRRWLDRMGVPFSAVGVTVSGGRVGRRLDCLHELARQGAATDLDLWIEAWEAGPAASDMRLGLRKLGAGRVGDAAGLDPQRLPPAGLELPLRDLDDDDPGEGLVARTVAAPVLAVAISHAQRVVEVVQSWPDTGSAAVHGRQLRQLVDGLEWLDGSGERKAVDDALGRLEEGLPEELEVTRAEWLSVFGSVLRGKVERVVGGRGGGVQLLTVMEARARTFDHLVVVGVERGVFPRVGTDDPLLPDGVRSHLAAQVLPFLPVKNRSAAEERYLFAHLLSSAPRVVCTWSTIARGRPVAPSPFVSRLALSGRAHLVQAPAAWRPPDPGDGGGPASALEHSVVRAEAAGSDQLMPFFAAALAEGRELCGGDSGVPVADLAAARSAVIARAEDPPPFESPGPWAGLVGPGVVGGDREAWVTTLERTATCPWQRFVTHRLGVLPMPDPADRLPDVDPQLVGNVAHQVLQRIVDEALGGRVETLGRAVTRSPQTVRWPPDRDLDRMLAAAADNAVRAEGLAVYRLAPLVAARAREILEIARTVAWGGDGLCAGVVGAELVGELELDEPQATIHFRADRANSTDGGLVLVDYKTGKPMSDKKNPDGRAADLAARVARGRLLQAVAYALAVAGDDHDGIGRYLYLRPEIGSAPEEAREAAIRSDDAAVTASFRESVAAVREAQQTGAMFPRVEEADKPGNQPIHCKYCPVNEACRRDDSTFRRRLVEWMGDAGVTPDVTGLAARRLWWLGVADD